MPLDTPCPVKLVESKRRSAGAAVVDELRIADDKETFRHWGFARPAEEEKAAMEKAVQLLNKSPYKSHIAASFPRRGLASQGGAGYYFAVSHQNVAIGGGVYMTLPQTLLAIRHHIAENHREFRRIVEAASVRRLFGELHGEQLSRVPKGFAKDHPAESLLRFKQFLLYVELPPDLATGKELYVEVRKRFRAIAPFLEFLNAPLMKSTRMKDERFFLETFGLRKYSKCDC